jgi:hypothetical protein
MSVAGDDPSGGLLYSDVPYRPFVQPHFDALRRRIQEARNPAPWWTARLAAQLATPQNAGDVAVQAATGLPMPPQVRIPLAAGGLLLGNSSEAEGGPIDRIGRHAARAATRATTASEAAVAQARREGWGAGRRLGVSAAEDGADAARRIGIGHNGGPPGPMPGDEIAAAATPPPVVPRSRLGLPINPDAVRPDRSGPSEPTGDRAALSSNEPGPDASEERFPASPHEPTPEEAAAFATVVDPRRMNVDQEGRPITAPNRSGRLEDGTNLPASPQDIDRVARALAGQGYRIRPELNPPTAIGCCGLPAFSRQYAPLSQSNCRA